MQRRATLQNPVALVLASVALILPLNCRKMTAELAQLRAAEPAAIERPQVITRLAVIYDGGLKPGWQDWGWGAHDLSRGAARIDMSNFGGWILHADQFPSGAGGVVFELFAPSSYGSFLQVHLGNSGDSKAFPLVDVGPQNVRPLAGGWLEVYVSFQALNPAGLPVDRLILNAKSKVGQNPVLIDKLALTGPEPIKVAAPSKGKFAIECAGPQRAISPYIYGVASEHTREIGATASRWGGNPTTRYNFQLQVHNTGKDWFFENVRGGDYRAYIDTALGQQSRVALTVPIIGWVAKDSSSNGFPVPKVGPQQAVDPYRKDAGNGLKPDGSPLAPPPPSTTSMPADPAFVTRWIEAIRAADQTRGARGVHVYFLDNEPNLWNSTHRDVHPEPLTYDELLDRTIRYATAIRKADPQALIAGPAEWGWTGYLYSARDTASSVSLRPDRRAHGDVPLIPWYLRKLREHEKATGVRLLDILDVHFYPQGNGVYSGNSDPATAALRVRSTRALWDPTYKDESWINDNVRLIPRLREWVAQNYPGLALSLGEYNFGGEQHISGALALAESLGRFGTEGLAYAFYWTLPPKDSPAFWAFRAFRNFDGQGGHFLERSLDTHSQPGVSLFASRDASGKRLVAIAVNLESNQPVRASITLDGCAPIATVRKFRYDASTKGIADRGTSTSAIDEELPPASISIFDIQLK